VAGGVGAGENLGQGINFSLHRVAIADCEVEFSEDFGKVGSMASFVYQTECIQTRSIRVVEMTGYLM
jgi:hypothetical protein